MYVTYWDNHDSYQPLFLLGRNNNKFLNIPSVVSFMILKILREFLNILTTDECLPVFKLNVHIPGRVFVLEDKLQKRYHGA